MNIHSNVFRANSYKLFHIALTKEFQMPTNNTVRDSTSQMLALYQQFPGNLI